MDIDAIEKKTGTNCKTKKKSFKTIWSDGIVFGPGAAQQIKKLCFQKKY